MSFFTYNKAQNILVPSKRARTLPPEAHIHIYSNEVGKMIVENIPKERPAVFTVNKIIINLQRDSDLQARISAGILIHLAVLELKEYIRLLNLQTIFNNDMIIYGTNVLAITKQT